MTGRRLLSPAAELSRTLGPLRRAVLRSTRADADLPDLPDTHVELLRAIADEPGISPHQLAERLTLAILITETGGSGQSAPNPLR